MTNPGRCDSCSCELQPGTEHHCAETKAPTTRALADDLWMTRQDVARLDARIEQTREEIDGLRGIVWDQLGESDADKKGTVDARLEALERKHAALDRRVEALYEPFDRGENTSRSEADGLTGGASGGGLDRNATPREGRCPDPAASALPPKPEVPAHYPPGWDPHAVKPIGDEEPRAVSKRAFFQWQARCDALESLHAATEARLAEAQRTIAMMDKANQERKPLFSERLLATVTADRDTLRTQLADMARAADRFAKLLTQLSSIRKAGETWEPGVELHHVEGIGFREACDIGRTAINQALAEAGADNCADAIRATLDGKGEKHGS